MGQSGIPETVCGLLPVWNNIEEGRRPSTRLKERRDACSEVERASQTGQAFSMRYK